MRIRDNKLQVWLSEVEAERLKRQSARCNTSRSAYVRRLINGYEPKAAPPIEYQQVLRELRAIGNNINQIAHRCNSTGDINAEKYAERYRELVAVTDKLSRVYLPERKK
jgi:hypothetical protein